MRTSLPLAAIFSLSSFTAAFSSGARASTLTCTGVQESGAADPHAKLDGIRLTIDEANATAVLETFRFEAHEAYQGTGNALVARNLWQRETLEVREEHDHFATYLIQPKEQYVVAAVVGDEFVRDEKTVRLSVSLTCTR